MAHSVERLNSSNDRCKMPRSMCFWHFTCRSRWAHILTQVHTLAISSETWYILQMLFHIQEYVRGAAIEVYQAFKLDVIPELTSCTEAVYKQQGVLFSILPKRRSTVSPMYICSDSLHYQNYVELELISHISIPILLGSSYSFYTGLRTRIEYCHTSLTVHINITDCN